MTHLMIEIVAVWFVAILAGLPLFASMGLAAFAFVKLPGLLVLCRLYNRSGLFNILERSICATQYKRPF